MFSIQFDRNKCDKKTIVCFPIWEQITAYIFLQDLVFYLEIISLAISQSACFLRFFSFAYFNIEIKNCN